MLSSTTTALLDAGAHYRFTPEAAADGAPFDAKVASISIGTVLDYTPVASLAAGALQAVDGAATELRLATDASLDLGDDVEYALNSRLFRAQSQEEGGVYVLAGAADDVQALLSLADEAALELERVESTTVSTFTLQLLNGAASSTVSGLTVARLVDTATFAVVAHATLTRLRNRMFLNLVQRDIAFSDAHVSGELSSRLIDVSGQG